jgi:hypothetical protein
MDLLRQLCVAESSTKPTGLPPVRRLDLTQNLSFSPAHHFFNGLLTLALFMARIFTHHAHHTLTPNDLAIFAKCLD